MKIVRDLIEKGNLNTSLYNMLSYLEEDSNSLHYSEHRLRHPLAIYNRGMSQFLSDYTRLVDFLIEYSSNAEEFYGRSAEYYGLLRAVLSSFASFIDDTYLIFKCFYHITESSYKGKYTSRWFQKADSLLYEKYEKYKKEIDTIPLFIDINNELKHANGRLSTVTISTKFHGKCFGFYVEGIDDNGCIIPNDKFHKHFNNMRTAFSFNWFIHEIFADFYFINEDVAKIIKQILFNKGISVPSSIVCNDEGTENISKLVNKIDYACSNLLFFDEYSIRPISQVSLSDGILAIQRPATKTFIKKFFDLNTISCQVSLNTSGDGMSRSFGLVYYECTGL